MLVASVLGVLLGVCSLSVAQVDLNTCGDEDSDITCFFFFMKVDTAFRNDAVLYTLRRSFFPAQSSRPAVFDVFMTLNIANIPNITCKDPTFIYGDTPIDQLPDMNDICDGTRYTCGPLTLEWEHQWSKTIISHIIKREGLDLLQDTNFVAYSTASFNSLDTSVFSSDGDNLENNNTMNESLSRVERNIVSFLLNVDFLPCRPDDGVLQGAWEDILPWIQLYAKNSDQLDNLGNVEYSQEERGYAFLVGNTRQKGLTVPLLTVIHILLNTVFALAITYLLYKYHGHLNQVKGKRYQFVASMYWSAVFLCFTGAAVIIAGNGYLYYALTLINDESHEVFGFRITSDVTVGILAVIELVASMLTPHDPNFFIPHLIRCTLTCNLYCRCCGSQSRLKYLRHFILGISMWIIILFLQLAISSLLPIAIVVISNPVPSLAFLSIMVSLFFCLMIFIAYFLNAFEGNYISRHKLSKEERQRNSITLYTLRKDWSMASDWARDKLVLIAQAFIFLVIFAIVALVVIIYLNIVRAGANTNSVGGLFFSLVPSAVLGGITWAAKKHLFQEFEEEEDDKEAENGENEESVLKIGGISVRPITWRRSTKRKNANTTPNPGTMQDTTLDNNTGHIDTAIEMDQLERKDSVIEDPSEALDTQDEKEELQSEENTLKRQVTIDTQEVNVAFLKDEKEEVDANDDFTTDLGSYTLTTLEP